MEDNLIPDRDELMKRISTMIKFPNSTWSASIRLGKTIELSQYAMLVDKIFPGGK